MYDPKLSRSGRLTLVYFKIILIMVSSTLFMPRGKKVTDEPDYGLIAI